MKSKRTLWLLAAICAASLALMVWALAKPQPTFTPPPFEPAAVSGTPQDLPETWGYATLDAAAYRLGVCGAPVVNADSAVLYLTNLSENTVWLKVRVYAADGTLLGESGLLRPGQYVAEVKLDAVPAESCPVMLKVMGYEPETYQSAGAVSLNTTLTVP